MFTIGEVVKEKRGRVWRGEYDKEKAMHPFIQVSGNDRYIEIL